jgi:hypothetical protein
MAICYFAELLTPVFFSIGTLRSGAVLISLAEIQPAGVPLELLRAGFPSKLKNIVRNSVNRHHSLLDLRKAENLLLLESDCDAIGCSHKI